MLELTSDEVAALASLEPRPLPLEIADVVAAIGHDALQVPPERVGQPGAGWQTLHARGLTTSDREWSAQLEVLLLTYGMVDRGIVAFDVEPTGRWWQRSLHGSAAGLVAHTADPHGTHSFVATGAGAWAPLARNILISGESLPPSQSRDDRPLAQVLPRAERVVKIVGFRLRGLDDSTAVECTILHSDGAWLVKPDMDVARPLSPPDVTAVLAPLLD